MRRALLRIVLLVVVPAAAIVVGAHYWIASGRYVTTENAYVKTNLIQISAEIPGRVAAVHVAENAAVGEGDPIFSIDPEPFRIALAEADARLAAVRNQIVALRASWRGARLELREAEQEVAYHKRIFDRQKKLAGRGHASRARFEEAEQDLIAARQRASTVRQKGLAILAGLGGDPGIEAEQSPEYREALAARDRAEIDVRRTVIRAPADGTIGRVRLQKGEYVDAGRAVMPLIETGRAWVEANLKETQLTHVRVGQQAEIVVDAFPDLSWRARVASISPLTGAELSVLPPQNASGNWVKIVQRVPVRLEVDGGTGRPFAMPAGATVSVSIDTGREISLFDVAGSALAFMAPGK